MEIKERDYYENISLKQIINQVKICFEILKKNIKIIFTIALFGAIIGYIYASFKKPIYSATISFVLEEDKNTGGVGGALGIASSFGLDLGTTSGLFTSSNIIELMKSHLMVKKALLNPIEINKKTTTLANYYFSINTGIKEEFPEYSKSIKYNRKQIELLRKVEDELIENNIEINQKDKKVSILYLTIKSKNEKFSKLFCEVLLNETSKFYIETKSKKARLNVGILQKQVDSIRLELNNSISSVAKYKDNIFNLNPSLYIKTISGTKKEIDVQANTAIMMQLITQLELSKISLRKETPLIQLIDSPNYPLPVIKTERLKSILICFFLSFIISSSFILFKFFYLE